MPRGQPRSPRKRVPCMRSNGRTRMQCCVCTCVCFVTLRYIHMGHIRGLNCRFSFLPVVREYMRLLNKSFQIFVTGSGYRFSFLFCSSNVCKSLSLHFSTDPFFVCSRTVDRNIIMTNGEYIHMHTSKPTLNVSQKTNLYKQEFSFKFVFISY